MGGFQIMKKKKEVIITIDFIILKLEDENIAFYLEWKVENTCLAKEL